VLQYEFSGENRFIGLMRTMTVLAKREITVHAEKAVSISRELLLFQVGVEPRSSFVHPVFSSAAVDVVDSQKLEMAIPAAFALPTVSRNDSLFQFSVVLAEVLLAFSVCFLLHQKFFSVLMVVTAGVVFLTLGILLVQRSAICSETFCVLRIVLGVFNIEIVGMKVFESLHRGFSCSKIHWLSSIAGLLKENQHGQRNGYWNKYPTRTIGEHRRIALGGSRQQCRDEKFSLIDLDAEMQTGRKVSDDHRDRLSERTSLVDDAIVGSCGNWNRKRTAEMTVPCFA